ncbi:conjugal transfer protein TraF [Methylomonas sp. AM2-LC]|uniref:conjugal transfer protein TraF n=1 Tax=Methylomonas sp. AM2-LC TaxID=3153301 RepID=UPI0032679DB0
MKVKKLLLTKLLKTVQWVTVILVGTVLYSSPSLSESFFGISDSRGRFSTDDRPYYDDKERGWFFYEEDPPPEIVEESRPPRIEPVISKPSTPAKPKAQKEKPLSSEWFRKHMVEYRDAAVDNPTKENVARYMYLQRVMLDKAELFTEATKLTVMNDPVLDENSRRPIATFGANAMDENAKKGVDFAARKLADVAGLWFFYSSTCNFCDKEASVLNGLSHAYGFKVMAISLDGGPLPNGLFPDFRLDQGQGAKLDVHVTPTMFLVNPKQKEGIIKLGEGLIAGDELIKRSIELGNERGWLEVNEYRNTLKANPITVSQDAINSIDEKTINDPNKLVNLIRNNLKGQLK